MNLLVHGLSVGLLLTARVVSQAPCPINPSNPLKGVGLFNTEVGGVVEFPNFRSAQGNHAGDALWKVYPKELFLRPRRDQNFITGVTLPWKTHNFVSGWPARGVAAFELRYAVRNASGYLVPDMSSPPIHYTPLGPRNLPVDGYWLVRYSVYAAAWIEVPSADIAIVVKAEPGRSVRDTDVYTAFRSTRERYVRAPQPSFSGRINGVTGQLELLVPPVLPEACELQMELCFSEDVARVSASTSKAGGLDPQELATGVGAFYNDLATSGGQLRWYFEFDGGGPAGGLFIPLFSRRRLATPLSFPGIPCVIDFDPGDPLTFVLFGQWGALQLSWRSPYSQFDNTVGTTPWITIPHDLSLRGSTFSVGCLAYSVWLNRVVLNTNMIETTLR